MYRKKKHSALIATTAFIVEIIIFWNAVTQLNQVILNILIWQILTINQQSHQNKEKQQRKK